MRILEPPRAQYHHLPERLIVQPGRRLHRGSYATDWHGRMYQRRRPDRAPMTQVSRISRANAKSGAEDHDDGRHIPLD